MQKYPPREKIEGKYIAERKLGPSENRAGAFFPSGRRHPSVLQFYLREGIEYMDKESKE